MPQFNAWQFYDSCDPSSTFWDVVVGGYGCEPPGAAGDPATREEFFRFAAQAYEQMLQACREAAEGPHPLSPTTGLSPQARRRREAVHDNYIPTRVRSFYAHLGELVWRCLRPEPATGVSCGGSVPHAYDAVCAVLSRANHVPLVGVTGHPANAGQHRHDFYQLMGRAECAMEIGEWLHEHFG